MIKSIKKPLRLRTTNQKFSQLSTLFGDAIWYTKILFGVLSPFRFSSVDELKNERKSLKGRVREGGLLYGHMYRCLYSRICRFYISLKKDSPLVSFLFSLRGFHPLSTNGYYKRLRRECQSSLHLLWYTHLLCCTNTTMLPLTLTGPFIVSTYCFQKKQQQIYDRIL